MGRRAPSSCLTPNSAPEEQRLPAAEGAVWHKNLDKHQVTMVTPHPMPARALPALAKPGATSSRVFPSKHSLCTGKTSDNLCPAHGPCWAPHRMVQPQSWGCCESNSSLQVKPSPECWGHSGDRRAQLVQRKSHVLHRGASISVPGRLSQASVPGILPNSLSLHRNATLGMWRGG